jgi:hypothetical protein
MTTPTLRFARQWDAGFAVTTRNKIPADLKREYRQALAENQSEPCAAGVEAVL